MRRRGILLDRQSRHLEGSVGRCSVRQDHGGVVLRISPDVVPGDGGPGIVDEQIGGHKGNRFGQQRVGLIVADHQPEADVGFGHGPFLRKRGRGVADLA